MNELENVLLTENIEIIGKYLEFVSVNDFITHIAEIKSKHSDQEGI